jgi:hypothetical protein
MRVAIGIKCHSGWAATVVIGASGNEFQLIDRRRIELVERNDALWAKMPYHAAEELEPGEGAELVRKGIESAHRIAIREIRFLADRILDEDHQISACAVLTPSPMPAWSRAEILAVHVRMHKAEGVLFPEATVNAAVACRLDAVEVPEKRLDQIARDAFGTRLDKVLDNLAGLGKAAGPPWRKDQKIAALAAAVALSQRLPRANT